MSLTIALKTWFKSQPSDEDLMLRYAATGDKRYLSQLYDNCADDLYHFIVTHSDQTLAKDICQRAWIRVIEKKHLYQDTGKFKAWLFTLARNQLFDEMRRNRKLVTLDVTPELPDTPSHVSDIDDVFSHALMLLPFEQREAFCLQQEGFSLSEIAGISHAPIETVKSRLRYAKAQLRKHLENYHEK